MGDPENVKATGVPVSPPQPDATVCTKNWAGLYLVVAAVRPQM